MNLRTKIMGIVNMTPDSFSDGSHYNDLQRALSRCISFKEEGADYLDIGGESTRPGHHEIPQEEELSRILPLIKELKVMDMPKLSIDSQKAWVMERALDAGGDVLNDIWGFQKDPAMAKVAASFQVPSILMHNQDGTDYEIDIIEKMKLFFSKSIELALQAGLKEEMIILDPGIGFGKTFEQNWIVMQRLKEIVALGYPVLLGTSRKGFLGEISGEKVATQRDDATLATSIHGVLCGVDIVRVHNVKNTRQGLLVTERLLHG